jgi:ketosteroid isomerase-like protein
MRKTRAPWLSMLLLVAGLPMAATSAHATETDEKAVTAAVTQFYAALNEMFTGNVEPMKAVWSHAEDVTFMGPGGGMEVGWKQALAQWDAQGAKKLGGAVNPERIHMVVARDLAVAQNYEIGENLTAQGKPEKVSIRATSVFRKEDGNWKMIGHHTDLLPNLAN